MNEKREFSLTMFIGQIKLNRRHSELTMRRYFGIFGLYLKKTENAVRTDSSEGIRAIKCLTDTAAPYPQSRLGCPFPTHLVKTPAARPKVVSLALSRTSASVSNDKMDMTGPKISSFTQVMSSLQSAANIAIKSSISEGLTPGT